MWTVSDPQAKPSYHHGALREELMAASLRLIEEEGIGAVSLRRLAREAGVSPGAPYHHFPDRAALLAALATQGFERLSERLAAARAGAATPQQALSALFEAYVRFAVERRAHFQLMFRPELTSSQKPPSVKAAGDTAFGVLTEVIADCQRAGVAPAADPAPLTALVWAAAHGLAALWLDGPLEYRAGELGTRPERLTHEVAAVLEDLFSGRA